MDWLKRVTILCVAALVATALTNAGATQQADAKPVSVAKRQFFEYLDAISKYQKKHDGNIPGMRKRWDLARKIFGSDLGFGILTRGNDYCVRYTHRKHFNYDSTNDHFYLGWKKAVKADDAFCWETVLAAKRLGKTNNKAWKLGYKLEEYHDEHDAFPATLDAEGQAAVGYVLPEGWSVGEYRIGEQGRKVFYCVQHDDGGFKRMKVGSGSPDPRGNAGSSPHFDPCPTPAVAARFQTGLASSPS